MLTEDFEFLVESYGPVRFPRPVTASDLRPYRGRLPNSLLDFWLEAGIGSLLRGKFQFCLPHDYDPVVRAICAEDPEFDARRCLAYGFTAFGDVYIWHERLGRLQVNLPLLTATADAVNPSKLPPERSIATRLTVLERNGADMLEAGSAAPLFERARKALGEPDLGECFGFVPALALGGAAKLANLRRFEALEHFVLLASLGRPRLMDYAGGGERVVRSIG